MFLKSHCDISSLRFKEKNIVSTIKAPRMPLACKLGSRLAKFPNLKAMEAGVRSNSPAKATTSGVRECILPKGNLQYRFMASKSSALVQSFWPFFIRHILVCKNRHSSLFDAAVTPQKFYCLLLPRQIGLACFHHTLPGTSLTPLVHHGCCFHAFDRIKSCFSPEG